MTKRKQFGKSYPGKLTKNIPIWCNVNFESVFTAISNTKGHGLGKYETGIKEPVKAKIKNDTKGVGHDAGKEFTFHWWDHMFNKAASSIQVETTENGVEVKKTQKTKNKSAKTYENKTMLYDQFVKGATLSDGRYKAEDKVDEQNDSDQEEPSKSAIIPANEEELFKQCGGRTAHKGARHGLKLNGKLARIEQQEQELLDRLTNKSANHKADNNSVTESAAGQNSANGIDENICKKLKKKKKRTIEEIGIEVENAQSDCKSEDSFEPHSKPCKKKRKKDKREKKSKDKSDKESKSDYGGNLEKGVYFGSEQNDIKACKNAHDLNSETKDIVVKQDKPESEETVKDLTLKKVKKKKKKKKNTV